MNPMMNAQLQQQWSSAMMWGQQGTAAEAVGNLQHAVQCHHQAASMMQQAVVTAQQWGIFVPDGMHATLSTAHMAAARSKAAVGFQAEAWQHMHFAVAAINQAIAQNGYMPAYHAVAGTIMMALGNCLDAERAFATVQWMMPGEPQSLQMLQSLRAMRGSPMPAHAPAGPGWVPQSQPGPVPGHGGGQGAPRAPQHGAARTGTDWVRTIEGACKMANAIMGTISRAEKLAEQF